MATVDGIEVPNSLTRAFIKTGGTNADYAAELAEAIVVHSKNEAWDMSYLFGKVYALKSFFDTEQKRLESYKRRV